MQRLHVSLALVLLSLWTVLATPIVAQGQNPDPPGNTGPRWPPGTFSIELKNGETDEIGLSLSGAVTRSVSVEVTHCKTSTDLDEPHALGKAAKAGGGTTSEAEVRLTTVGLRWQHKLRPSVSENSIQTYLMTSAGIGTYDIGTESDDFGINARVSLAVGLPSRKDHGPRYAFEIGGRFHQINTDGADTGLFDLFLGARIFFGPKHARSPENGTSDRTTGR